MKFINSGEKHADYDLYEDTDLPTNEEKLQKIPSYIDTAKKHSNTKKSSLKSTKLN